MHPPFVLLLLCTCQLILSSDVYLFDLTSDPYEETSLADDDAYGGILAKFETRCAEWETLTQDVVFPDTTDMYTAWDSCGGVCPWLDSTGDDDDDYSDDDIVQLYDYSDAPHIVFVFVDDWGYNTLGLRSSYVSWTTPNIDSLAEEGVLLTNYYSHFMCIPSRGAFLTGRYANRIGLASTEDLYQELNLTETTLAQELKTAGYRNYMVGKWHMGYSTKAHLPTNRGFDYYYGYYNGLESYYSKEYLDYLDLQDSDGLVTDADEISSDLHNGYLLQIRAEQVIATHSSDYSSTPMFLYYAMQLAHSPFGEVPTTYTDRCGDTVSDDDYENEELLSSCGMNLMIDEAIGNLTCTLEAYGMSDNTVLIIASDNGAEDTLYGANYPYRGYKGHNFRGGVSVTALIHSVKIPSAMRGSNYSGLVHVTDWLPSIMHLATGGEWTGSSTGKTLDGVNVWSAITTQSGSPRTEILHYHNGDTKGECHYQMGNYKYAYDTDLSDYEEPSYIFEEDLDPDSASSLCSNPSLVESKLSLSDKESIISSVSESFDTYTSVRGASNEAASAGRMVFILAIATPMVLLLLWLLFLQRRLAKPSLAPSQHQQHKAIDETSPLIAAMS